MKKVTNIEAKREKEIAKIIAVVEASIRECEGFVFYGVRPIQSDKEDPIICHNMVASEVFYALEVIRQTTIEKEFYGSD